MRNPEPSPDPAKVTTSAATPGGGHSMPRDRAEAVTAILAGLREQAGSQVAAPGDPATMAPATGCPVCGCQPPRARPVLPAGPATRLVAWLAENYHRRGLRAGEIAAAAGVSVRRLQVICRRDFGRTPMQLLADIRLHRVHLALTGPGAAPGSIAEVACAAGFTRVSRFTSAYQRRYGTAPAITARIAPDPSPVRQAAGRAE